MKKISLSKFVSRYFHLSGEVLSKMTHKEIAYMSPYLVRATFEEYNKEESLPEFERTIILVDDGHRTIPYYIPVIYEDEEIIITNSKPVSVEEVNYYYSSLSEYELHQLMRKDYNSYKDQYAAKRELNRRGLLLKRKYNRNEFKKGLNDNERD